MFVHVHAIKLNCTLSMTFFCVCVFVCLLLQRRAVVQEHRLTVVEGGALARMES